MHANCRITWLAKKLKLSPSVKTSTPLKFENRAKTSTSCKNLFDSSFHSEINDVTHDLSILDISETEENSDTKDTESNQLNSEIVELLPLAQKN